MRQCNPRKRLSKIGGVGFFGSIGRTHRRSLQPPIQFQVGPIKTIDYFVQLRAEAA
jgi:hypothetical protein